MFSQIRGPRAENGKQKSINKSLSERALEVREREREGSDP